MNPAPMLARTSLMGRTNPLGAPFWSGMWDRDRWVLAMQMGSQPKPCVRRRERSGSASEVSVREGGREGGGHANVPADPTCSS